jgi:drug/metabolite transporter (DMT)-like permease
MSREMQVGDPDRGRDVLQAPNPRVVRARNAAGRSRHGRADLGAVPISLAIRATQWYACRVREQRERGAQHRLSVSLILLVSMTAAGVVYPVTDSALHHTSPIMIATLRAVVGGLLLTAMLPLIGSRLPRTRRLWAWAFAIGLGNTTLTQIGISVGTARAGAAVAAVLLNSSPFFVAVIAWFALAEPITRPRAAGLVIGFGGVLLVVLADPGNIAHGSRLAVGFALSLLGALGWAAGGVGMRVLAQRESDLDIVGITAAQFLAGGVPLIPLALLAGGSTDWSRPSLFAQLAYLIIGGQLLVYVGFNAALSRWPSTRVYAWTFLVPVVAVLIEAVRGALPGTSAMVGIALVIVGVAIVNHPRSEPSPVAGNSNHSPTGDPTYPTADPSEELTPGPQRATSDRERPKRDR